ncbi:MAG: molybdopterin-dependent oxidoreductase [Burkholderiales bacterium]|jgi:tetrathionate reductase subunit A|nr:molybdopterin-dependent oxidoreductase [Burkholderiales bacterium]
MNTRSNNEAEAQVVSAETDEKLSRKDFLRRAGQALVAGAAVAAGLPARGQETKARVGVRKLPAVKTELDAGVRNVYTNCLGCDHRCGVRVRVEDGRITRVQGNPYSPQNMGFEEIPYGTPAIESLKVAGNVCLKGGSAAHVAHDPYRILKPLKRKGPRGSDQWEVISWQQLIDEVVEGGQLFKHIGEDRRIDGLRAVRSFEPVDPKQPELGPKANQVIFANGGGGYQQPRPGLITRWTNAYGTTNYVDHTDACQLGWYMGFRFATDFQGDNYRADYISAEFIMTLGITVFTGGKPGLLGIANVATRRAETGELKMVTVDPKAPRTQLAKWVPIQPGKDLALILGMTRWIIDNNRYDKTFLENPNESAAKQDREKTYCGATFLVMPSERRHLRGKDIGATGNDAQKYVVFDPQSGSMKLADQVDRGDLFYSGEIELGGKKVAVKSGLAVWRDLVRERTIEEYAKESGVPAKTIADLAREFTSHGKKAATDSYRGIGHQPYGPHTGWALWMMNNLIGNVGHKGGLVKAAGTVGGYTSGAYDLNKLDGAPKVGGVRLDRRNFKYEDTTEFRELAAQGKKPYPSKLPWYPLNMRGGAWGEMFMGADHKYPYPAKIAITYFADLVFNMPAGARFEETFADPDKIPLHIAVSTQYGMTARLADYIVPDCCYLDGMYFMEGYHGSAVRANVLRAPALPNPAEGTLERFLIDTAVKLGMVGFGDDAIPDKNGTKHPFKVAEDYCAKGYANIAFNVKTPKASAEEVALVEKNHICSDAFKKALTADEWAQVCYLLARGGVFQNYKDAFDENGLHKATPAMPFFFYSDRVANTRNPATGELWPDLPRVDLPGKDFFGRSIESTEGGQYGFYLTSTRHPMMTKARTQNMYWALEIMPENYVEINVNDAKRLGVKTGDDVRVSSRSLPKGAVGKAKVTGLIAEGVIGIYHSWGQRAYGATDMKIDGGAESAIQGMKLGTWNEAVFGKELQGFVQGEVVKRDPRRGKGIWANQLGVVFDYNGNRIPSIDPTSGAPNFMYSRVKVEKV